MKIGDRIYVRGYIDEIRKDTIIIRNAGGYFGTIPSEVITGELPSAQPERTQERTETHACDCISRQMLLEYIHGEPVGRLLCDKYNLDGLIEQFPSAQPEPLSDAYMKSVWTWLLEYQIKAAELKGRYTPYEVLSWVVNDWRKEHEGSD